MVLVRVYCSLTCQVCVSALMAVRQEEILDGCTSFSVGSALTAACQGECLDGYTSLSVGVP